MRREEFEMGDHCASAGEGQLPAVSRPASKRKRASIPATDHARRGIQKPCVREPGPICDDHASNDTRSRAVAANKSEADQRSAAPPGVRVSLAPIIAELGVQWRQRQAWHRAEKSLTLQAKALCRRLVAGDKKVAETLYKAALGKGQHPLSDQAFAAIMPLVEGRGNIEKARKAIEKRLQKLAKELPIKPVRGVGLLSIAGLVGEAGAFTNYSTVAKLWKRMGLAVMSDGKRQRKIAGDAAIEHGYSPARRSVVWTIGDCIIKAGGPLKELYNERKLYESTRVETKMHAHNRAKRYIEKRLLRQLWQSWRAAIPAMATSVAVPPANLIADAA